MAGKLLLFCVCVTVCAVKALALPAKPDATVKMASLDYSKLPIEEKALYVPPLQEIADVLAGGLGATFEGVETSVVQCPDLTAAPFNLVAPGITGEAALVELGGPPYLTPLVQRDKLYDLARLLRHLRRDPALLVGAGAGPWPYARVNCEGIINLALRNDTVEQGTRIVTVEPPGAAKGQASYKLQRLPNSETRTALLGNYLLSDGAPGPVIKVVAKKRVGESNFITAIRESLKKHYGDKVVGLGGTFLLREGKAKFHVMPDFSSTPIESDADIENWLHYFEMRAPIVHVGTLVTGDLGLDLRVQHFHGWGAHGDGGHYHYDTTPAAASYEGYFVPAKSVLRVDRPEETHGVGRD